MATRQEMKDWAFRNQKFIKLEDGESITAILTDAKWVESKFDSEKEIMRYYLKLDDNSVKHFENGSTVLADTMAEFLGTRITLTREGEGAKTKYIVQSA